MPSILKTLLSGTLIIGIGVAAYFTAQQSPSPDTANVKTKIVEEKSPHPLYALAEHHCSKLTPDTETKACLQQIEKAISAGELAPVIPEVNPLACNGMTDPVKQHECHGWMGHDFAVSTGDIKRCEVIPQDDIKASCKRSITINDIKNLHAIDNTPGNSQP